MTSIKLECMAFMLVMPWLCCQLGTQHKRQYASTSLKLCSDTTNTLDICTALQHMHVMTVVLCTRTTDAYLQCLMHNISSIGRCVLWLLCV